MRNFVETVTLIPKLIFLKIHNIWLKVALRREQRKLDNL